VPRAQWSSFPTRGGRVGGDGCDELLPEGFPVAIKRIFDDFGRGREHGALPGRVEGQLAVAAGTSSPDRLSGTSQRYDLTHCHPGQARSACIYLNQAARRAFVLDNLRHLT
jgi:hypothetical protein